MAINSPRAYDVNELDGWPGLTETGRTAWVGARSQAYIPRSDTVRRGLGHRIGQAAFPDDRLFSPGDQIDMDRGQKPIWYRGPLQLGLPELSTDIERTIRRFGPRILIPGTQIGVPRPGGSFGETFADAAGALAANSQSAHYFDQIAERRGYAPDDFAEQREQRISVLAPRAVLLILNSRDISRRHQYAEMSDLLARSWDATQRLQSNPGDTGAVAERDEAEKRLVDLHKEWTAEIKSSSRADLAKWGIQIDPEKPTHLGVPPVEFDETFLARANKRDANKAAEALGQAWDAYQVAMEFAADAPEREHYLLAVAGQMDRWAANSTPEQQAELRSQEGRDYSARRAAYLEAAGVLEREFEVAGTMEDAEALHNTYFQFLGQAGIKDTISQKFREKALAYGERVSHTNGAEPTLVDMGRAVQPGHFASTSKVANAAAAIVRGAVGTTIAMIYFVGTLGGSTEPVKGVAAFAYVVGRTGWGAAKMFKRWQEAAPAAPAVAPATPPGPGSTLLPTGPAGPTVAGPAVAPPATPVLAPPTPAPPTPLPAPALTPVAPVVPIASARPAAPTSPPAPAPAPPTVTQRPVARPALVSAVSVPDLADSNSSDLGRPVAFQSEVRPPWLDVQRNELATAYDIIGDAVVASNPTFAATNPTDEQIRSAGEAVAASSCRGRELVEPDVGPIYQAAVHSLAKAAEEGARSLNGTERRNIAAAIHDTSQATQTQTAVPDFAPPAVVETFQAVRRNMPAH